MEAIGVGFTTSGHSRGRTLCPTEYQGKAVIGKVDVDTNQEVAAKYGIRNIPTILFFKDGEVVDKVVGVVPKEQLVEKLNAIL